SSSWPFKLSTAVRAACALTSPESWPRPIPASTAISLYEKTSSLRHPRSNPCRLRLVSAQTRSPPPPLQCYRRKSLHLRRQHRLPTRQRKPHQSNHQLPRPRLP